MQEDKQTDGNPESEDPKGENQTADQKTGEETEAKQSGPNAAIRAAQKRFAAFRRGFDGILVKAGRCMFGPNLSLRTAGWIFFLIVPLALASVTYRCLQDSFQHALFDVALSADILAVACSNVPALDQSRCAAAGEENPRKPLSDELIWNILLDAGIINTENVSSPAELYAKTFEEPALRNSYQILKDPVRQGESGLQFLIGLSRGVSLPGATNETGYDEIIGYYVAGLYPEATKVPDLNTTAMPLTYFRFQQPTSVLDSEIATAMLKKSKATVGDGYRIYTSEKDSNGKVVSDGLRFRSDTFAGGKPEEASAPDIWHAHEQMEKLLLWGIGQVRTTPDYRAARFNLTLVTGPEQFWIFYVGWFALTLSLVRLWTAVRMVGLSKRMIDNGVPNVKNPDDILNLLLRTATAVRSQSPSGRGYWKEQILDQVVSARWPMRVAISTLPAIGFIGTVRGIMNSLTGADTIVWATTAAERAQAISALAADLGLAFATTMLALAFGILLGIVAAIETRIFERAILPLFGAYAFNDTPAEEANRGE